MEKIVNGVEFDPGFAPYIYAFQGTLQYLYTDINKFKNLSQRQMKFKQYYKKILQLFENNVGFYIGCLMWASWIKKQDKQEILNNHCYGQEYNENDNSETEYIINFTELFPKDMKYYAGQNYSFNETDKKVLMMYKEFVEINKGFVELKYNVDIKLPQDLKQEKVDNFKQIIDDVINLKDLSKFRDYINLII